MGVSMVALALVASGVVRFWTDCPYPCLDRAEAPASWSVQTGALLFRQEMTGAEVMVTRAFGVRWGAFQPVAGASLDAEGGAWAGAGVRWTLGSGPFTFETSFMPGLQMGGEHDLGHPVEFRSGVAFAWEMDGGATLALTVDHRSNAGLGDDNPGLETVGLRVSWALD